MQSRVHRKWNVMHTAKKRQVQVLFPTLFPFNNVVEFTLNYIDFSTEIIIRFKQ